MMSSSSGGSGSGSGSSSNSNPPKHPAKYSDSVLTVFRTVLDERGINGLILDPFAGIGRIHDLKSESSERLTIGVEIEREWAEQRKGTITGSVLDLFELGFDAGMVDCIATSPAYGNRMADHHNARDDSVRHTYRHYLGRELSKDNSGMMQWGDEYRKFHRDAWKVCVSVLKPGGWVLLNISDHVRKGEVQKVSSWHKGVLGSLGIVWIDDIVVNTRRNRHGANGDVRMMHEWVFVGRKKINNGGQI